MTSFNKPFRLKGQYTIFAMFMTVITIIAYSKIYPVLKAVIDDAIPGMTDDVATILSLSPLIILLFILYGAMWYVIPNRETV